MTVNDNGTVFTRRELYDLLTDMPANKLALKYGLDIADLMHSMEAYHIHPRTSEDWARIAAGQAVQRTPMTGDPDEVLSVAFSKPEAASADQCSDDGKCLLFATDPPAEKKSDIKYVHRAGSVWGSSRPKPVSAFRNSDSVENKKDFTHSSSVNNMGYSSKKRLDAYDQDKSLYSLLEIAPSEEYRIVPLVEIQLSARSVTILLREGLDTLHKILASSLSGLLHIRNLGYLAVETIMERCKDYCLRHPTKSEWKPVAGCEPPVFAANAESSPQVQESSLPIENTLLADLLSEFTRLNRTGQEIIIQTIKAMTSIEKFTVESTLTEK